VAHEGKEAPSSHSRADVLAVREPRRRHGRAAAFLHLAQLVRYVTVEEPRRGVLGVADVVAADARLGQRHADAGHQVPDVEGQQRHGGRVVPVRRERPGPRQRHAQRAARHARQEAHGAGDIRVHQRRHPRQRLELAPRAPRRLHEPAPVRRDLKNYTLLVSAKHASISVRKKSARAYVDEGPAVAEAEDGVHDVEAAVRAGEHELVLALQQVEPARQDAERLDGGHEERAQAGAAEVVRQRAVEAELHARLHAAQVVERDHPAHRQVRHVPHHLGGPRQADHQPQDGEPGEAEVHSSDHRHAPHGDPREARRHHQVRGAIQTVELIHRLHRALEHPRREAHTPRHPARVQPGADGEHHHRHAQPHSGQHREAHEQRAHGQGHTEAGPEDDAHHSARPRAHGLLPREGQHDAERHRALHGQQPVPQQAALSLRVVRPWVLADLLDGLEHEEPHGGCRGGKVEQEEAQRYAVGVLA
jgi:hypothetical protein